MSKDSQHGTGGSLLGLSQRMQSATSWMFKRPAHSAPTNHSSPDDSPVKQSSLTPSTRFGWYGSPGSDSADSAVTRSYSVSADSDASSSVADIIRCSSDESVKTASSSASGKVEDSSNKARHGAADAGISSPLVGTRSVTDESDSPNAGEAEAQSPAASAPPSPAAAAAIAAGEPSSLILSEVEIRQCNEKGEHNQDGGEPQNDRDTGAEGFVRPSLSGLDDHRLMEEINRRLEESRVSHKNFTKSVVKLMSSQECLQAANEKFKARVEIASRLTAGKA